MKITNEGVVFLDYQTASPHINMSQFTDSDGGTLLIATRTLVRMYELVKFDLAQHNAEWQAIVETLAHEHRCS